jgi:hypothetical protein
VVVQFAFKEDFNSDYQAMWGQKTEVLTPKVLAIRPNLHNGMHASLFPEDNKRKNVDQVQFCLKYCSAAMYYMHAEEKKNRETK